MEEVQLNMDQNQPVITIRVHCGKYPTQELVISDPTTLAQMEETVRNHFPSLIHTQYNLQFYDRNKMAFVKLLRDEHEETDTLCFVGESMIDLFVIADTNRPENTRLPIANMNQPTDTVFCGRLDSSLDNQFFPKSSSDDFLYSVSDDTRPIDQTQLDDQTREADKHVAIDRLNLGGPDIMGAFLADPDDIDDILTMVDLVTPKGDDQVDQSHRLEEVPRLVDINSSTGSTSMLNEILVDETSINPSKKQSNRKFRPSQRSPDPTPATRTRNNGSPEFFFSWDVHPIHKDAHLSDEFPKRNPGRSGKRVCRLQGLKISEKPKASKLPSIHVSEALRQSVGCRLALYVVSEVKIGGTRQWFKHKYQGFLPHSYVCDSKLINPIMINLVEQKFSQHDDFKLDVRLIANRNGTFPEDQVHELPEEKVLELHPAEHVPNVTRLIGFFNLNGRDDTHHICLSGFIRSTRQPRRKSKDLPILT